MKKSLLLFGIFASLILWSCDKNEDKPASVISADVKVGDVNGGGTVFYIAPDRTFGLVAAPEDVNETGIAWSALRVTIPTEKAIGTGAANTQKIIELKTKGGTEVDVAPADEIYAAKVVAELTTGGYSDWYLPSIDELTELYRQRAVVGGFNETKTYWSSSAIDGGYIGPSGYTYFYDFNPAAQDVKPVQTDLNQHYPKLVRAIRTLKAE
ncbi:MAG: DUF1566 domain-containing protein [Dysgonamonadaceae bacterium]|jgi:hypothetical protein|nr:DUF1566 domain-containing protein [Dysgonamonadaceae bacterium]